MAYQNFFATRLGTDIGANDNAITLETIPTATSGRLVLEARNPTQREIIKYTGVSGNQITGVLRGQGGTTAKGHLKNSLTEMNVTAEDLSDALSAPNDMVTRFSELFSDSVVRNTGVVTVVSGLTGAISDITYYIGGNRYVKTAIPNKVFTASKDTYCMISITGTVSFGVVNTGAAAPALPADNIYFAKVTTSATNITSITQMSVGAVTVDEIDFSTLDWFRFSTSLTEHMTFTDGIYKVIDKMPAFQTGGDTETNYLESSGFIINADRSITVGKSGLYAISAALEFGGITQPRRSVFMMTKGGGATSLVSEVSTIAPGTGTSCLSGCLVRLTAGDKVEIRVKVDGQSTPLNHTRISGYLVQPG